jgi:hypothetical protein
MVYQARLGTRQSDLSPLDHGGTAPSGTWACVQTSLIYHNNHSPAFLPFENYSTQRKLAPQCVISVLVEYDVKLVIFIFHSIQGHNIRIKSEAEKQIWKSGMGTQMVSQL